MDGLLPVIMLVCGALAGAAAGFGLARLMRRAADAPSEAHEKLRLEQAALQARCTVQEAQRTENKQEIDSLQRELRTTREAVATLEAQKQAQEARIMQHQADLKAMQEQNRLQFEHLAAGILEKNTAKFNEHSAKSLQDMLSPLKKDFGEFRKTVDESFGAHFRTQSTLKEEIQKIVLQADGLTKALKGDSKAQGNWGEIILERILEEAGLQKGREYTLQGVELGMKHTEHGGNLKPDVIVNLPEGKHLIIDSKVSLTHYERFCSEEQEAERAIHLKMFLKSLRNHVDDLEERRYQNSSVLGTPDFVMMFMPIEGAFALALQQDAQLHAYAWGKQVTIVCPSTLFATLRTVASVWRVEQQNRNTQKIAEAGGKLYDKMAGFVQDIEEIGERIEKLGATYNGAMNKLKTGKGNILRQAEQLRELGAKTSKQLPKQLMELGVIDDEAADMEEVA